MNASTPMKLPWSTWKLITSLLALTDNHLRLFFAVGYDRFSCIFLCELS